MRCTPRRTPLKRLPARSAALVLASAIAAATLLAGCGTRGPLVLPPKPASAANAPAKPAATAATTSATTGAPTNPNPSTQINPAETAR